MQSDWSGGVLPWTPLIGSALGDLPLVVGLDHDSGDDAQDALVVGENPDDVGAPFDLSVDPLQGIRRQIFFQWATGKWVKARRSSLVSTSMAATPGHCAVSMPAISVSWERTWMASGWAKMVRIDAATISAEALGTRARTFLIQWTRHRIQR